MFFDKTITAAEVLSFSSKASEIKHIVIIEDS